MKKNKYDVYTDFCDEVFIQKHCDDTLKFEKKKKDGCVVTHISILNKENPLHKEVGEYITIEFENMYDAKSRTRISSCIKESLDFLTKKYNKKKILVVGLGNRNMVSDALGPKTCDEVLVTSHLFGLKNEKNLSFTNVAVLTPGVMGQTGMESIQIVLAVAKVFKPDLILAIDALATSSLCRINSVIQINNVSIRPGSGVGNYRKELNEENLGCPLIAIGVATVTSVGAILKEVMEDIEWDKTKKFVDFDLVVTPKNMDDDLTYLSHILSLGINRFLHKNFEEM